MAKFDIPAVETPLFTTKLKVLVCFINAGMHLAHDSLISMLQEVRTQYLATHGYSEADCEGLGLLLGNLAVEYQGEGFYGDELTFTLGVGKVGTASVELYYQVTNQKGKPIAKALTTLVFFSYEKRKPSPIPEKVRAIFQ